MTELEILAELKTAYLNLEDIIDNADNTQLKSVKELYEAQDILAKKYVEVYGKVKKENKESLFYKEDLIVGTHIYYDYLTTEEEFTEYIPYTNLDNEEKWWEDYKFLLK